MMQMKRSILFYISGHGFGHTTRSIEVIKRLLHLEPNLHVFIKTGAPAWFFRLNLRENYTLVSEPVDVGLVQKNSFVADKEATLKAFAKFYLEFKTRLPSEVKFVRENKVRAIVGDIPPLAFEVSRAAGVPGMAIANFSWDWIYEPYAEEFTEYKWVVPVLKMLYGKADALLRLPLHGDLSAFPNPTDIPFIARRAEISREEVRKKLNFLHDSQSAKIALISLRKADLQQIDLKRLESIPDVHFLAFSDTNGIKNVHPLPPDFLPYPELVHASDVVISKPGYGIVSECIANKTPLLFTGREDFREYAVLAEGILNLGLGTFLPQEDFFSGNWAAALENLPDLKTGRELPPVNGGQKAAEVILENI
ncbi:hypothetical protein BMS3Abin05_00740 [bacterium BMS3Abin05]|nr:hypothetical protein BMS3Abin05_00740 [bacterium BMS3Abin05]GBE28383.1 hypothetical protein BMS3Bbin03_02322 [bacterium BMS3Bbin03]